MNVYAAGSGSGFHFSQDGPGDSSPGGGRPRGGAGDGSRLQSTAGLLATVAADCPMAVLLIDFNLRLLYMNPEGDRLLQQGDGITLAAGLLKLGREEAEEVRLRRALSGDRDAIEALARAFYLSRPSGRRPYELTVRAQLRSREDAELGLPNMGLIYVRDPDEGVDLSVAALRRRFGLTTSEARTALAVLAGGGMEHSCEQLGLRPMTVRGYLRQVFDKTGAHTQADLVRLLLCGESHLNVGDGPAKRATPTTKREG